MLANIAESQLYVHSTESILQWTHLFRTLGAINVKEINFCYNLTLQGELNELIDYSWRKKKPQKSKKYIFLDFEHLVSQETSNRQWKVAQEILKIMIVKSFF